MARTRSVPPSMMEPANTWSPGSLGDGDRLAGDRRLVGGGRALDDDAVDGGALARAHHHDVADDDVGDVDARLLELAVAAHGRSTVAVGGASS